MADERFLVTGGTGCIGSWVVRALVHDRIPVTVLASHRRFERMRLVMSEAELHHVAFADGDVNDKEALEAAVRRGGVTRIIHLAALQFPFCAADPVTGARVNVEGTVAMFELARRLDVPRLVYASSAAVFGPAARYPTEVVPNDAPHLPTSHYGVFKVANEQGARVYWETGGISSIGLRPHSAYGPGRDQGVTSKPTLAMIAAAAGRPYAIDFSGAYQFQFVEDVAAAFVAAARSERTGAEAFSLPGPRLAVDEMIAAIEAVEPAARGRISSTERTLPFPAAFDGGPADTALGPLPQTPLIEGVRRTIETYRKAIADGRVTPAFLDRVLGA